MLKRLSKHLNFYLKQYFQSFQFQNQQSVIK